MTVAESNIAQATECTTCHERVVPPELPVLTWKPVARERGTPRPEPDHIEHLACNLRRRPRRASARGAA